MSFGTVFLKKNILFLSLERINAIWIQTAGPIKNIKTNQREFLNRLWLPELIQCLCLSGLENLLHSHTASFKADMSALFLAPSATWAGFSQGSAAGSAWQAVPWGWLSN